MENKQNLPVFLTGVINGNLTQALVNKGLAYRFPYGIYQYDKFVGDDFAAATLPCLGYPLSDGRIRLFYMDTDENIRGMLYSIDPIFDSTLRTL